PALLPRSSVALVTASARRLGEQRFSPATNAPLFTEWSIRKRGPEAYATRAQEGARRQSYRFKNQGVSATCQNLNPSVSHLNLVQCIKQFIGGFDHFRVRLVGTLGHDHVGQLR